MLESQGIVPDYVVGTSAGAVVGSLYAGGNDAFAMQKIAVQLDEKIFADWTLGGRGLLKGEALQDFINQHLNKRPLEKLNKPFATVATDLNSGERVVFRSGDTGMAVRASAAVPGVFQPTQFRGRSYVDGGLTSPVPVQAARDMGADFVIAVDISDRPEGQPVQQHDQHSLADHDHHGRHHRPQRAARCRRRHSPHPALRQVVGLHGSPRRHDGRRKGGAGGAAANPPETGPVIMQAAMASGSRVLSLIPPMTQLNVPYPSTAYLTGFLRSRGIAATQADIALALVLDLFSPDGLREIRQCVAAIPPKKRSPSLRGFDEQLRPLCRHRHTDHRLSAGA